MLRSVLTACTRIVVRVFFRRIEVSGRERIPTSGPVMFVLNHPNALIDPAVLMVYAGRPVSFLAKEPLFRMPVLGWMLRSMDCIPVYRQVDQADMTQNRRTFSAARKVLEKGGSIAIFPEGRSHLEPRMMRFRTGAARIALGAAEAGAIEVVPAALFYTDPTRFRSSVLLCFGASLQVRPVTLDEAAEPPAEDVRLLTDRMESSLGMLTLQADEFEALRLAGAAERILTTSDRGGSDDLADRLLLQRRLLDGYARLKEEAPARLETLRSRITRYEAALRQAGLSFELLPVRGYQLRKVALVTVRTLLQTLVLVPLAVVGTVIHAPGWYLAGLASDRFAYGHPDGVASVKALAGVVFYLGTWVILGLIGWLVQGPRGALLAALAGPVSGWAALRLREVLDEVLGAARGLLLAVTGKRRFLRFVAERRAIRDELVSLGETYGI